jgi:hypothetical protein
MVREKGETASWPNPVASKSIAEQIRAVIAAAFISVYA